MAADYFARGDWEQPEAHRMVHLLSDWLDRVERGHHQRKGRHEHQRRGAPPDAEQRDPRDHAERANTHDSHQRPAQEALPVAVPDRTARTVGPSKSQPRAASWNLGGELPAEQDDRPQVLRGDGEAKLRCQPRASSRGLERGTSKPSEPEQRKHGTDGQAGGGQSERITGAMQRPKRKLPEQRRRRGRSLADEIRHRPADDQDRKKQDHRSGYAPTRGDHRAGQPPRGDRRSEYSPAQEPLCRPARQATKREVPRDQPRHPPDECRSTKPADGQPTQRRPAIDGRQQHMLDIGRLEHQRTAPSS